MKLLGILFATVVLLGACSSSATTAGVSVLGASIPKCTDIPAWRCGTVTVPLDRANPLAGTIKIAFFVQNHQDTTKPALEPIFVSPGGPGGSVWPGQGYRPLLAWDTRHDTVLIEPRGVGRSGAIICQELQAGVSTISELRIATADCGRQLGQAADRYGSGDVALDIEGVRKALGVASFDFYEGSYATIAAQAYVTRFPTHVHALVLDSGFPANDPMETYALGIGYSAALIRVLKLLCQRTPLCANSYPQPQDLIDWLVRRVASSPIRGSVPGTAGLTVVDEAAVEVLLVSVGPFSDQLQTKDLLDASAALKAGDPNPIRQLVEQRALPVVTPADPVSFSNGDNAAAVCNDQNFPWAPADPLAVREQKLAAAYAALPPNTFDPFTTAGWAAGNPSPDSCITWPPPSRFEPVIPPGAKFPSIPTLIASGDEDTQAPEEINRLLLAEFPGATYMVVAGAGHGSTGPGWGSCGIRAVATFFDTLRVDPNTCATFSG